jgi:uncharacterized protein (TIGR03067 family)
MRLLKFVLLVIFAIGCSGTKNSTLEVSKLNGNWTPVYQEIAGKELPIAAFATEKLFINDSNYTFEAESIDKGVVKFNDGKMDIYGKEGVNEGKHITAIYKLENEQLKICYNLSGDHYPESFETKGEEAYFLSVFKKILK